MALEAVEMAGFEDMRLELSTSRMIDVRIHWTWGGTSPKRLDLRIALGIVWRTSRNRLVGKCSFQGRSDLDDVHLVGESPHGDCE